jgi:hypothetical protein
MRVVSGRALAAGSGRHRRLAPCRSPIATRNFALDNALSCLLKRKIVSLRRPAACQRGTIFKTRRCRPIHAFVWEKVIRDTRADLRAGAVGFVCRDFRAARPDHAGGESSDAPPGSGGWKSPMVLRRRQLGFSRLRGSRRGRRGRRPATDRHRVEQIHSRSSIAPGGLVARFLAT